jgi:competence protein ComEC
VRGKDRQLHLMRTTKDAFLFKEWLAADADARGVTDPSLSDGVSCDDAGCVMPKADGALVALSLRAEALADDCARAALVVSVRQPPSSCAASVIDRERVQRQGALALRQGRGGFVVDAVRPRGMDRPWSPAPAAGADTDASFVAKPSVPRARDATPSETDLQSDD